MYDVESTKFITQWPKAKLQKNIEIEGWEFVNQYHCYRLYLLSVTSFIILSVVALLIALTKWIYTSTMAIVNTHMTRPLHHCS